MKYVLLGLGYISKKHLKAIHETGGELIAAHDPYTSVGILDQYFPECEYFSEFEMMDNWLEDKEWDFLVICTPNYLHYSHIKYGLSKGKKIICEKPVVINRDHYRKIENEEIYPMLQMRTKNIVIDDDIYVTYNTKRGRWYYKTWKNDVEKSGGILYNICIHLIDLLVSKLGKPLYIEVKKYTKSEVNLHLDFDKYVARCMFSLDKSTKKIMQIGDKEINLNNGFNNLHTEVYRRILAGKWITVKDIEPTIQTYACMVVK
jgi:UDP-N-acetyl-2-amino-2-deoxyglucuronate dehydrogenase